MMTDLLLQSSSKSSGGWSWWPIVVLLFIISPLVLFWGPIRRLIHEWRLYRRCQKYPHIVVCKKQENSKNQKQLLALRHLREKAERIANNLIKRWLLPITAFLFTALGKICSLMLDRFLAVLTFKKSGTSTDETEIPSTTQPASAKEEQREEEVATTKFLHGFKEHSLESVSSPLPVHGSSQKEVTHRSPKTSKYYYNIQGQSTDLFESSESSSESSSTTEDNKHAKKKRLHDLPSKQSSHSEACTKPPSQQQQQQPLNISRGNNITRISGSSKRKFSSPIMAAATTVALTESMCIDSTTSLSDQMRKRRLNGENIALQQNNGVVESRKKRRLNSSRTSVFQGVARRQTGSFWQSRKPLDKREREEREERLLRGMNRSKRTKPNDKPIIENPKLVTGTESTTAAAATNQFTAAAPTTAAVSGPAFNFGQAGSINASDKQGTEITATSSATSSASAPAPAPAPAPAITNQFTAAAPTTAAVSGPAFNFGQAGSINASDKQGTEITATSSAPAPAPAITNQFTAAAPTPAAASAPTFNFGQAGANTSEKKQAAPDLVSKPSTAPLQFGGNLEAVKDSTAINPQPSSQAPPSTTANTVVATTVVNQPSFAFGSGSTSAPAGAPAPTTASTQVQFGATAGQGNNSVTTSQQSAPAQGITFGSLPGSAPAPAPTAGLTQNQFGSTGQFNSAAALSSQQSGSTQGNQFGAPSTNQSFSGFAPSPAPAAASQQSVTQGFNQNTFGSQTSFGNTKENTNPGMFNSTFQQSSTASSGIMPPASNGFSKPNPTNGNNTPPFGMNAQAPPSFGAGAGGPVASSGASARRQQRRSRTRRR
jgi:hypothetical protein